MLGEVPDRWLLLIYRVPSTPSRNRVAIWREMKRMGSLYLQQCVCLAPGLPDLGARLAGIRKRIDAMGGSSLLFEIPRVEPADRDEIVESFREQSGKEYEEIIEECTRRFQGEIQFDRERKRFSFEEAEEVYADLRKLKDWLARVIDRDWFGSPKRAEAEERVAEAERAYDAFERDCFNASADRSELRRGRHGGGRAGGP
jgi:hypothetical protein